MTTWHATLTFATANPYSDDDAFDLLDALAENGAALSVPEDHKNGSVTFTIDAATAIDAVEAAASLLRAHAADTIGAVDIAGIEILSAEAMDANLAEPTFPEVVGYAEIADMGGFSRQRARQLAEGSAFPHAVIKTAQGPLYSKHAVERWLDTRNRKPGRPAKTHA